MQSKGRYALQITGVTPVLVIDGASENSPFACPRAPAIYANHSAKPNAAFQCMLVPRPSKHEVRKRMYLVATEPIEAGAEIRVNYGGSYWCGAIPPETRWRDLRVRPPPPTAEEPVFDLSTALNETEVTLPWEGAEGGDSRLRVLVPMLTQNPSAPRASVQVNWAMVSTHLPGRSGLECRERWQILTREAWEAANSEGSGNDSDASDAGGSERREQRERCVVLGCRRKLLRCHGAKDVGSTVGRATEAHVLCVPCLDRWFISRNELRQQRGLAALTRRSCPVCMSELRTANGDVRGDGAMILGMQKLEWSW